ncbi:MAG TPA: hypothetical protein VGE11_17705 [Pseudonocardia sp.]
MLLTCGDPGPHHGSRALAALPSLVLPPRPERTDLDPVLTELDPRRVIVSGDDADLAAVLVRLLRRDRLDVEVAYLPRGRSVAARVWGLPRDVVGAALDGVATPVPLVRDDSGGVLVGEADVRNLHGECYCDETLVLRGLGRRLRVRPRRDGIAVRASRMGRPPDGRTRAVAPRAPSGRGSAVGRAVQLGGAAFTPVLDGVPHPRPVTRWAWYRHTTDWRLVTPR